MPALDTRAGLLRSRYEAALAVRREREGLWRSLQAVVQPTSLSYEENQGAADTRERRLLDSTAADSLELFASFLMSEVFLAGTSDAAIRFVPSDQLGVPVRPHQLDLAAQQWLQDVAFALTSVMFSGRKSGVAAIHNLCLDLGLYGAACIAVWRSKDRDDPLPVFRHYPVWQVAGDSEAVYILDVMSARQARSRWPEHDALFSARVSHDRPDAVQIVYACLSAKDPDIDDLVSPGMRALGAPYYGVWMYENNILAEERYTSKPVIFAPWYSVDNTPWGRSPAMTALGDVFLVNNLSDITMRGAEKLVDPPLEVRDGALLSPARLYPGGLTYTDSDNAALKPIIPPGASRIEVGVELLRDRQARIERAFFLPLFQTANPTGSKQPRTAYEVALEKDERSRAIAPMVLRIMGSVLEPLVQRLLDVLLRDGLLPPMPASLGGFQLKVMTNSPLVLALQQTRMAGLERWVQAVSVLAQSTSNLDPLDNINVDKVVRILHGAFNAPVEILRSQSEVEELRRRRVEAASTMADAEAAAVSAKAAAQMLTAANKAGIIGTR